ncbi:hypothetical protein HYH03_015561 [Edaphochlamys debaryana]|uniref:phytol kinase n=1 Tax=Edaphochlamys debaryana TaxID=47281 RepID=A0A835XLZ1_9CHLO|nr:hypothetical protein HYH03_015561 [Edaphochlamys debaryana]|eukprot:KAG2485752.1 hypothetical protein HYH03_015561 [Edaphochlamys debaryana]
MDSSDRMRRLYMSGRREEEEQRNQELSDAEAALEEVRAGLGYGSGGWGAASPESRLQWLDGCAAEGVPAWTLRHLRALPAPIAAACRTTASFDTIRIAVDLSELTIHGAGLCLTAYNEVLLGLLEEYEGHAAHIRTLAAPFISVDFLYAASRAASNAADLARHLQLSATQAQVSANVPETLAARSADIGIRFAIFTGHSLLLASSLLQNEALSAAPLPPLVPRLAAAVRDSQLPAGVARALMTCPRPNSPVVPGQGAGGAGSPWGPVAQMGVPVWPAVPDSLWALAVLTETALHLHGCGGAVALSAGSALGAALAHPHVASLRLALLQTLWERAGLGPRAAGQCSGSGGGEPHVWVFSCIALVAVGMWQEGRQGLLPAPDDARLPAEPGVPPGLQLARAAARTAEALCRLSRSQGLARGFSAEQRRQLLTETCLSHLLPFTNPRRPRSPEELPHWAEASAWVVAAALEGLEAAAAECAGEEKVAAMGSGGAVDLATALASAVRAAATMASELESARLTASQREGLAASLRHAGLAASLDHALRLAFAAADRAAAPGASEGDRRLAAVLGNLLPYTSDLLSALTPACGSAAAWDVSGVALTLAKRASLVARGLEAAEATAAATPAGAVQACLGGPRGSSPGSLAAALGRCGALLRRRWEGLPEGGRGAAAEPAPAGHSPAGGGAPEGELGAYFFQAAGRLAAQLGADAAACELRSTSPEDPSLQALTRTGAAAALTECLAHASALCSAPGRLAAARLLACQPHRLIAAACKLLVAWRSAGGDPDEVEPRGRLEAVLSLTALRLAAHPSLSARVRRWLVPSAGQWEEAAGGEASSAADALEGAEEHGVDAAAGAQMVAAAAAEAGTEAERGCLVQAWGEGWRSHDGWRMADGSSFSPPLTLLRLARGGGAGGGRGADWEADADAAFRSGAMGLLVWAEGAEAGGSPTPPQLPEGMIQGPREASSPEAMRAAAAALRTPLPPHLKAPPEGRALPKLRVCGFPGCASFGGRSEAGLALRPCGGCRAVRYCGPGCQRAHWREGHQGECGALAEAAARAATGAGE